MLTKLPGVGYCRAARPRVMIWGMTMRIVKVQGGIGNQFFCLAMAHSLACLTGETVGLDVGAFRTDRYGHRFELGPLAKDLPGLSIVPPGLIGSRIGAVLAKGLGGPGVIGDRLPPANRSAFERLADRGRWFIGYWQDEAWIAEPDAFIAAARRFLNARAPLARAHQLAVHYRSYADETRADRRGAPAGEFFRAAYAKGREAGIAGDDIVLISDRPDLAAMRIAGAFAPTLIQKSDKYADLATLAAAETLILTNSSFSWWGGYLSKARLIAYPRRGELFHYPAPAGKFTVV